MTNKNSITNYSSVGVFVGLATFEINKELENFYDSQINIIFEKYREELGNNITDLPSSSKKEFDFFYQPRPYYIFGKFDLAFISLIEDFEICGRSFRPFNGKTDVKKNEVAKPFDYKIMAGNFMSDTSTQNQSEALSNKLNNTLPFIAICSFKINNVLLLKYGYKNLNIYFQKKFNEFKESDFLKNEEKKGKHLDSLIFETVGSFELTLLFFANSYDLISTSLIKLREITFDENIDGEIKKCPFFEHSNSTYGFDLKLFKENLKPKTEFNFIESFSCPPKTEKLSLNTRWFVKPGILKSMSSSDKEIRVSLGYGDVVAHTRDYKPIKEALGLLMKAYRDLLGSFSESESIFESRSLPVIKFSDSALSKLIQEIDDVPPMDTTYLKKNKHNWLLSEFEIREIEVLLRQLGTAKIIRNKVVKIISNYNNIVSNPLLHIYFLDLSSFFKLLLKTSLNKYGHDIESSHLNINQLNKTLRTAFLNIENAYTNRFFQSSVSEEITDINSEYFGAIHQSISAFDFVYKTYNSIFEGGKSSNIVIVGSSPRIESTKYFIRVNYFHVFQPEIFAAICCHESTNYFFDKISAKMLDNETGDTSLVKTQKSILRNGMDTLTDFGFKTESYTNSRGDAWKENPKYDKDEVGYKIIDFLSKEDDYFLHQQFVETYFHPHLDVLKYFIKDLLTLKIGYCNDSQLFSKWHWNYFLQIPMNYGKEGEIRKEKFCIFLLRMTFVLSEIDSKKFENFYAGEFQAPNRILQRLWDENFKHVQWIFSTIFSNNKLSKKLYEQIENIKKFAEQLVIFGDNENQFGSNRSYEKIIDQILGGKNSDNIEFVTNCFKNGEILDYKPEESFYTQVSRLNFSILQYHYEGWKKSDNLLHRNEGIAVLDRVLSNLFKINSEVNYSEVLVDRQGGLFSVNFEKRKELLKVRSTFIKSLWELSLHKKRDDFISTF